MLQLLYNGPQNPILIIKAPIVRLERVVLKSARVARTRTGPEADGQAGSLQDL